MASVGAMLVILGLLLFRSGFSFISAISSSLEGSAVTNIQVKSSKHLRSIDLFALT
jgi:hypothetical protein